MPLSKNRVIEKETADRQVIPFHPVSIDTKVSKEVQNFKQDQDTASKDFRLDKIVSQITGIDEIERESRQRDIEKQALVLSKDIQEEAYSEAYALGFEEGKAEAFAKETERINNEIESFHSVIQEVENLKTRLMSENRDHILKLCFYFAKRLLMKEVENDEAYVVDVIRQSLEMAQSDEHVTIRVSPSDYKFLMENRKEVLKELDLAESTRIEEAEDLQSGGAIVETNYGVIDASIDERLAKLENFISEESQ